jgi:hypothetical protein
MDSLWEIVSQLATDLMSRVIDFFRDRKRARKSNLKQKSKSRPKLKPNVIQEEISYTRTISIPEYLDGSRYSEVRRWPPYSDPQEPSPAKPTDLSKEFGKELRIPRELRRFTKRYVANVAGVSSAYISGVELGKIIPSEEELKRIAAALELPPKQIRDLKLKLKLIMKGGHR